MHPIVDQAHPPELRDYLGVVATRKWSVMLITLAVTAAALAYSARQTPVYQAEARVHVRSVPIGEYQAETSQTETQLVASEQVAERVGEDLGVDPGEALGGLQVTAVEDSRVLGMYYTSEDPDFAARAANSFAHHYIELRQEQAMDALVAEQRDAERRIRDVETALADVLGEMADARDADDSSRLDALQAEQLSLSSRLGVLRQHLDILASQRSLQLGMGEVIRQAEPPGSPYSPDLVTNGLLGLLFGLGLGIATVFLRQKLDSRFAARAEVESALGAPILATISKFKLTKKEPWDLVMLAQPRSAASEAYRGLRTNLQVLLDRLGSKSLLVTSPSAGEGKTITAANLAVAFAQSGRRVALVSADLRRPRVESYLRVANNGRGLSWWLSGREDVAPSMSPTPVPNLEVLTSGTIPGSPAELLTSPRLGRLVEHLKQSYDLVIFDSAPLLPVADSVGLSFQLDATLMVLNAATTHRASTEHARAKVERVGGRLLGAVLNAYDPTLPYYIHERDYYYDAEAFASAPAASNGRGRHATPSGRRGLFSRR